MEFETNALQAEESTKTTPKSGLYKQFIDILFSSNTKISYKDKEEFKKSNIDFSNDTFNVALMSPKYTPDPNQVGFDSIKNYQINYVENVDQPMYGYKDGGKVITLSKNSVGTEVSINYADDATLTFGDEKLGLSYTELEKSVEVKYAIVYRSSKKLINEYEQDATISDDTLIAYYDLGSLSVKNAQISLNWKGKNLIKFNESII